MIRETMTNNIDKVNPHDHSNHVWLQSRSPSRPLSSVIGSSKPSVQQQQQPPLPPSFRRQIESKLTEWQALQEKKTRSRQPKQEQQQQEQTRLLSDGEQSDKPFPVDDFDRIIIEDVHHQLKDSERKEEKQYQSLKQDDAHELREELQRNYMKQIGYIKALKLFQANEQQQQYNAILHELEECEQQEQLDKNQNSVSKTPWKMIRSLVTRRHPEDPHCLLVKKRKQMLQLQLSLIEQNQIKTQKIIDLIESHWRNKKFYISIPKPYYHYRY